MPTAPLVTVLVAVHNGERYLRLAVESMLRGTISDLELLVVDDASTDRTPEILARVEDPRLVVLRNDEQRGLAASLNRALDDARGRYVARLDADDVALPLRLEAQLAHIRSNPQLAVAGSAVLELDEHHRVGKLHVMPSGAEAIRWAALFSSPFFHPTVLLDRDLIERHGLRYDTEFLESEDYDLWTRLLAVAEGDNLREPQVLYRVHGGQASRRRRDVQRDFQRRIALREIARVAPSFSSDHAELAWRFDQGLELPPERAEDAAQAYVDLYETFAASRSYRGEDLYLAEGLKPVRRAIARVFARRAIAAQGVEQLALALRAFGFDYAMPVHAARRGARRAQLLRGTRRRAQSWLAELGVDHPVRVAAVFPEPTPYRAPLLDRIAALDVVELTVLYAAPTVARRTWNVEPRHRATYLRGVRVPGAERVLHHDYPVTPAVTRELARAQPDVVVVSGWSTFAAQGAIAWCRVRKIPYVLVVESHDAGPRPDWRRRVKGAVVPPIVRGAAGALVTGTLARRSMIERGASPENVHVFANTIDVAAFGEHADLLASGRPELREALGAGEDDVVVLSVARLVPEKGHDVLVRAVGAANDPRLVLVLAGDGPERARLESLAAELGVRLVLTGDRPWDRIAEVYVAADVFALLSEREPWAVVVNEAAACGLPLVLSERVGAAHDLLHHGDNGFLVAPGAVDGAAAALARLASDPEERRRMGARSREIVREWGYEPSVAGFLAAVRAALADGGAR